jgi:hypothetical protein
MHSPIDVVAGCAIGASLLIFWCHIDEYLDAFITRGDNVISFWAAIAVLALYAYPTPESPTPSFGYHTAFNGVAFGIVSVLTEGVTYPLCYAYLLLFTTTIILMSLRVLVFCLYLRAWVNASPISSFS